MRINRAGGVLAVNVSHMMFIALTSIIVSSGCAGGCECAGDEPLAEPEDTEEGERAAEEAADEAAEDIAAAAAEVAPRLSAVDLGGPVAGPKEQAEEPVPEGGEEERTETAAEALEGDGFDPSTLVPMQSDEGDDFASGLSVLCTITERVLERHGAAGDPIGSLGSSSAG